MALDKHDFIVLDHTADLGIMVHGSDIKNLFEQAAHSMIQLMVNGIPAGKTKRANLSLYGEDLAELMVLVGRDIGQITRPLHICHKSVKANKLKLKQLERRTRLALKVAPYLR